MKEKLLTALKTTIGAFLGSLTKENLRELQANLEKEQRFINDEIAAYQPSKQAVEAFRKDPGDMTIISQELKLLLEKFFSRLDKLERGEQLRAFLYSLEDFQDINACFYSTRQRLVIFLYQEVLNRVSTAASIENFVLKEKPTEYEN